MEVDEGHMIKIVCDAVVLAIAVALAGVWR